MKTSAYVEFPVDLVVNVNWSGISAVKWNYSQFLYRDGQLPVPNSPTGTMSFWVKFAADKATAIQQLSFLFTGWINLLLTYRTDQYVSYSGPIFGDGVEYKQAFWQWQFYPNSAEAYFNPSKPFTYAYLMDTAKAFAPPPHPDDPDQQWYHVFAQWNTGANPGTLSLTVNGKVLPTFVLSGSQIGPHDGGPPFNIDWGWPTTNDPDRPNIIHLFDNPNPADQYDVVFSLAEMWIDADKPPSIGDPPPKKVTIDKFVDLRSGKPKGLGANGELPTGSKPAFFFSRSGKPETFVRNRGYAGDFKFARTHYSDGVYTPEDIPDPSADPPLDEPQKPSFAPVPESVIALGRS